MTWNKIDPKMLPQAVVCYADSTIALPLCVAFFGQGFKRQPRRLVSRLDVLVDHLRWQYLKRRKLIEGKLSAKKMQAVLEGRKRPKKKKH